MYIFAARGLLLTDQAILQLVRPEVLSVVVCDAFNVKAALRECNHTHRSGRTVHRGPTNSTNWRRTAGQSRAVSGECKFMYTILTKGAILSQVH